MTYTRLARARWLAARLLWLASGAALAQSAPLPSPSDDALAESQTAVPISAPAQSEASAAASAPTETQTPAPTPAQTERQTPAPVSAQAESVWTAERPSLLQIRTLLEAAGSQSSIGSGFLVSADGLAITNYHVVSNYALEPGTYRLEFARPDGTRGALKLLAIDIANDLAVVKLDGAGLAHLEFDPQAVAGHLPRGDRVYSLGNPLDLGFAIVEGNYNGLVEHSYTERMHFTGAINSGMSGGPAVTSVGKVVGVNVAKRLDGEQVSFLVPAAKAAALLERARHSAPLTLTQTRAEIGRQLLAWQNDFYRALNAWGLRATRFGHYQAPQSVAPWLNCWASTNAEQRPRPRALTDGLRCESPDSLFIASDLDSGRIQLLHTHVRNVDLNAFQFAAALSRIYAPTPARSSRKRMTRNQCHDEFVAPAEATAAPLLRAVWCARAYRDFADLYDMELTTVTQDRDKEALVSFIFMRGVSYDNGLALARRFMESITWTK
ncbi:MAG: trypsin-like peptidase domain-containing protein [Burkholderiaceae bacterium]|jgi:S1-C subfamily serine protease|nr:trypsin-like peptidase domain-containing protein [Burkholderiaceae bacterium]